MWALFTHSRGELFVGRSPARTVSPATPCGGCPATAGPGWAPPVPFTAALRPQPRRAAPPPPTQETLRENGPPQGKHRPRRCPARRGPRPSHREPSPECPWGRGAAARPAWRSRVPAGAGSPHGRTVLVFFAAPPRSTARRSRPATRLSAKEYLSPE